MRTVGLGMYYEDLPVGATFKTIGRTITDADITNFVNATGLVEVLFTNLEFLREESDIQGRVAPGALAYCFAEGLLAQATMQHTGFAFLEMDLKIEGPTLAGDTIHVECEVTEDLGEVPVVSVPVPVLVLKTSIEGRQKHLLSPSRILHPSLLFPYLPRWILMPA